MMRGTWLRMKRIGQAALLAGALVLTPLPARAADDEDRPYREPGIIYNTERKPYIEWLAGTLIILACLMVGFKNPRRSHLD